MTKRLSVIGGLLAIALLGSGCDEEDDGNTSPVDAAGSEDGSGAPSTPADDMTPDPPTTEPGGSDDVGGAGGAATDPAPDAGTDAGMDAQTVDAGGADDDASCVIDLPPTASVIGSDPIFGFDSFTLEEAELTAGSIVTTMDIGTVLGPMNSPIVACTAGGGAFRVEAEGIELDGADTTRFVIGMTAGYTGAGTYELTLANGLEAEAAHSDVGESAAVDTSVCQVCVATGEMHGAYRCMGLQSEGGLEWHVLVGSFDCRD